MILPDVNVLLYVFRGDSPHHAEAKQWLSAIVNGSVGYGMAPQVLSSVIRIATNPRVFINPSRLEDVFAFTAVLLEPPHCQIIQPGPRHWEIFRRLSLETGVSGNLVPDAWFAALAIESGCEWITTDGDYARFKDLRWRRPF